MSYSRTFKEFYYIKENKILSVSEIENEFYKNNNLSIGIFENNIFCPECYRAKLIFVQKSGKRRCHLRTLQNSKHLDECSYNYEYATNQLIESYMGNLSNEQIEDKLNSMIRYLFKSNEDMEKIANNYKKNLDNPILIKSKSINNKYSIKSIRRKSLNSWIDLSMKDNLYIFYGKVKLKAIEMISKKDNKYYLLKIFTLKNNEWIFKTQIYLNNIKDKIDENKVYNIVFIANVSYYKDFWELKLIRQNAIKYL